MSWYGTSSFRLSLLLLSVLAACTSNRKISARRQPLPISARSESMAAAPTATSVATSSITAATSSIAAPTFFDVDWFSELPEDELPEGELPEGEVPEDGLPEDELPEGEVPEGEVPEDGIIAGVDPGRRYTAEISDEQLESIWATRPALLGSISIGLCGAGRLVNAEQFPAGGSGMAWTVNRPDAAWATSETIGYVKAAAERVKSLHAHVAPLRVSRISLREGGFLRPHRSHQNGRDVDLGFYYSRAGTRRCRGCNMKLFDMGPNWELVKSVVMLTDVELIFVDRAIQKRLYIYALSIGENKAWLDSLFKGQQSILKHARGHRDHFHVRFFNPRAQELGRRIAPLLAKRRRNPNLRMYQVKWGDNLGTIAFRNKSSVSAILKANRMSDTTLRVGQVLRIPVRGPCTRCPVPPTVRIPPRRLPPTVPVASR